MSYKIFNFIVPMLTILTIISPTKILGAQQNPKGTAASCFKPLSDISQKTPNDTGLMTDVRLIKFFALQGSKKVADLFELLSSIFPSSQFLTMDPDSLNDKSVTYDHSRTPFGRTLHISIPAFWGNLNFDLYADKYNPKNNKFEPILKYQMNTIESVRLQDYKITVLIQRDPYSEYGDI